MKMMRFCVSAAVLASAIAAAGCSADSFTALNATFTQAKKGAVALSDTALPAAAIATSLGAVELVKALSTNSKALISSGAGNISGGQLPGNGHGSNVIAAGAGNFAPTFSLMGGETSEHVVENAQLKVSMKAAYSSDTLADGTTHSAISRFYGTSQGYTIDARGEFNYLPHAGGSADVNANMTGTVTYGTGDSALQLTISKLQLKTSDPLPADAELGSFGFDQKVGDKVVSSITAALNIKAGKIGASGSYTDKSGKTKPINFDQDSPTGTSTSAGASADASAGTATN